MISPFVASAAGMLVCVVGLAQAASWQLYTWMILDLALTAIRVLAISRMRRVRAERSGSDWSGDVLVAAGIGWCLVLGLGAAFCLLSGDPALAICGTMLAFTVTSTIPVHNPGSPRLNRLQILLIEVPMSLAAVFSAFPGLAWLVVLIAIHVVSIFEISTQLNANLTELVMARKRAQHMALHCALTGLPNRTFFDESLRCALNSSPTTTVLCLDLDNFKAVNDLHGHHAGDELLQQVADRIRSCSPQGAVPSRWGGDEFAIMVTGDDPSTATRTAEGLIRELCKPYFLSNAVQASIGVSVGLASSARFGHDGERLLKIADNALYVAKQSGKGTFRWGDDDATEPSVPTELDRLKLALSEMRAGHPGAREPAAEATDIQVSQTHRAC
jgi:diguanylate cyclase (GGDEF)-like protein